MMMKVLMVGGVVLGLAGSPSFAQQPTTAERADRLMAGGAAPDAPFIIRAAHASMAEVELGKLALEKAGSEEVKKFAQRMVDDHTKANDELKTLAQNKNFTLPEGADPHVKTIQARLSNLSARPSTAPTCRRWSSITARPCPTSAWRRSRRRMRM
jgi:predicted outer membrane protein